MSRDCREAHMQRICTDSHCNLLYSKGNPCFLTLPAHTAHHSIALVGLESKIDSTLPITLCR